MLGTKKICNHQGGQIQNIWICWGGEHNTIYIWCITELYTWTLCNFTNPCQPNNVNESEKKREMRLPSVWLNSRWNMERHDTRKFRWSTLTVAMTETEGIQPKYSECRTQGTIVTESTFCWIFKNITGGTRRERGDIKEVRAVLAMAKIRIFSKRLP